MRIHAPGIARLAAGKHHEAVRRVHEIGRAVSLCVFMGEMTTPLQYGDPPQLGPFVLQARLRTAPAGLVYLGQSPDGRAVSVAVLTSGAALDAAARGRFVTAIKEAEQQRSGLLGWMSPLIDRVRGRDTPAVLAMQDGS